MVSFSLSLSLQERVRFTHERPEFAIVIANARAIGGEFPFDRDEDERDTVATRSRVQCYENTMCEWSLSRSIALASPEMA